MNKFSLAVVAGVLAYVASAAGAQAAVITQSVHAIIENDQESGGEQVYGLPFDPSLGTLTSVGIAFSGTVTIAVGGYSETPIAPDSTASLTTIITVDGISEPVSGTATFSGGAYTVPPQAFSFSAGIGMMPLSDFEDTTVGVPVSFFHVPTAYTDPQLAVYSDPGFEFSSDQTSGSGTLTITYNYTPVPEPATLGLLAFGVLGLFSIRRLRHHA